MNKVAAPLAFVTILCALCGCQQLAESDKRTSNPENFEKPANYQQHVRNNTASLLYDLLNDEKNVGKLLIVKRNSDELGQLIKDISTTTARETKELESLAKHDRTLNLQAMGLPSGEAAARKAESETKEHELLHASGTDLQFKLLLTQAEALNYGSHLAKVAAENEANAGHARQLSAIESELVSLYARTVALLRKTNY